MILKTKLFRRCITFFSVIIVVFYLLVGCAKKVDPRLIKNHNTTFIGVNDTLFIDELKPVEVGKDTVVFADKYDLTQKQIKSVFYSLVKDSLDFKIINVDLYMDFRPDKEALKSWIINLYDVKYVSVFYIEDNKVNFKFYDLKNNKKEVYKNLWDASCNISLMFLLERCENTDGCSLLGLHLKKSEIPNRFSLILPEKEKDTLYQKEKEFFDKLKK